MITILTIIMQLFFLGAAIGIIYYGASVTLDTAEKIGLFFSLSPLLIGLFIVGFGTSLPEFFVSQAASFHGEFPMAIGNILGSNIANLFLVMGIVGVISPLNILKKEIGQQFIFHLILTLILVFVTFQKEYSGLSAIILGLFFIIYLGFNLKTMKNDPSEEKEKVILVPKDFFLLVFGLILLFGGGELLVYSGKQLGMLLSVSTFFHFRRFGGHGYLPAGIGHCHRGRQETKRR